MKLFPSPLCNVYLGKVSEGLKEIIEEIKPSSVFIIADQNTEALCLPVLNESFSPDHIIITRSGEINKNLETCGSIWSALIEANADRSSLVLNLGGGVVCDMGGFASVCYMRGIRFAHLPTTLMAMADASIGGKLGIDYKGYKNYIGSIRSPSFVWIDRTFLDTLPEPELVSGFAEIIKHSIIGSRPLWDLVSETSALDKISWEEIFTLNIPLKIKIVENDLFDNGSRKKLNFGHTIGHALESYYLASTQSVRHGQCVAIGMLVEAKMSAALGILDAHDLVAIEELIFRLLKPNADSLPDYKLIRVWMKKDKKRFLDRIGFSLPDSIGSCRWGIEVDDQIISESYDWVRAQAKSVPFRLSREKKL